MLYTFKVTLSEYGSQNKKTYNYPVIADSFLEGLLRLDNMLSFALPYHFTIEGSDFAGACFIENAA